MTAAAEQRRPRVATRAPSSGLRCDTRLPADLHHRLAAVAVKNDRSVAAEARVAIARHVDRELGGAGS